MWHSNLPKRTEDRSDETGRFKRVLRDLGLQRATSVARQRSEILELQGVSLSRHAKYRRDDVRLSTCAQSSTLPPACELQANRLGGSPKDYWQDPTGNRPTFELTHGGENLWIYRSN